MTFPRSLTGSIANLLPTLVLLALAPALRAAPIVKANNSNALNLTTSWVGSVVPGSGDTAVFDSTITTGLNSSLGASLSWQGISFTTPGGAVTINATSGATLTLGTAGLTASSTGQNLTMNQVTALGSSQTWDVTTNGRTLAQGGRLDLGSAALTVTGAGATTLSNIIVGTGSIIKNGAGALTLSATNTTPSSFSGGITQNLGTLTISGQNAAGAGLITAAGGTLAISATQSALTGGLTVSGAAATLSAADSIGGGTVSLSTGSLTISNGTAIRNSTLNFTGGTFGFATLTAATVGGLTGTANLALTNTAGTPAAVALTVGNNNLSPAAYTGNLTGLGSIVKIGTGTQILNGANTFTGIINSNGPGGVLELGGSNTTTGAVALNAGTLRLNFNSGAAAVPASNILATTNTLTFGGGTLAIVGKDASASGQTFASSTTSAGSANAVSVAAGTGGGTAFVDLKAITRNSGTSFNFTLPGGTASATNGILTTAGTPNALLRASNSQAYGVVGGTDWAAKDATNTFIIGFSTLATNYTPSTTTSLGTSTQNSDIASGTNTAVAASATINTIRFNQNEARAVNIASGQTVQMSSSGILVTSNVATAGSGIFGGTLTSGATPDELIVHQYSSQPFTISSAIANQGADALVLTKTGPGTLILSGANTHTGTTYISSGRLQIGAGGNLASSFVNLAANDPTAIFDVNNQVVNINNFGGGGLTGGSITLGQSGSLTLSGVSAGTYSGALVGGVDSVITKNGAGSALGVQTSSNLALYGTINVTAGTLAVFNGQAAFSSANINLAAGTFFNHGGFASAQSYGSLTGSGTISGATSDGSGVSNGTTQFGFNNAVSTNFSGVITNTTGTSTGVMSVGKYGSGTATLSGVNTYGGSTTAYSGNLVLDYSTGNNVLPGGGFVLFGGTATFKGGTGAALNADTTGAFSLNSAAEARTFSKLVLDHNSGSGFSTTLTTTAVNSTAGLVTNSENNSVLFDTSSSAGNHLFTSTALATQGASTAEVSTIKVLNGVLQATGGTGSATFVNTRANILIKDSSGYAFATTSGTEIVRFTGATALDATVSSATANYVATGTTTRTAALLFNTLQLDSSGGAVTVNLAGNAFNSAQGAGRAVLATGTGGGTISATTGSTNQAVTVHNYLTGSTVAGQTLTLDFTIGNTLTSNGIGLTTYTKVFENDLYLESGVFRFTTAQSYGDQTGANVLRMSGGVLEIGADLNGATAGDFTRNVSGVTGGVTLQGDTGFSAFGGNRVVNLGAGQSLAWGVDRFLTNANNAETNATFKLSSVYSDSTLDFQNSINLNARARAVEVAEGSAAVDARLSGVLSNSNSVANTIGSLTKTGAGTLELSNTNTYTGPTTVQAGTLFVSGSISGSTVLVQTGATLGGGTTATPGVTGAVTVQTGGTLSPGSSIGTLSTGAVVFATGSTLAIEVGTLTADRVDIAGAVTLTGDVILALILTADPTEDTSFTLLNGTTAVAGYLGGARFSYLGNALDEGEQFTATTGLFSQDFTISYLADGGNDVVLLAVPEPGAAFSLLGGLGLLLGLGRRRRPRA